MRAVSLMVKGNYYTGYSIITPDIVLPDGEGAVRLEPAAVRVDARRGGPPRHRI